MHTFNDLTVLLVELNLLILIISFVSLLTFIVDLDYLLQLPKAKYETAVAIKTYLLIKLFVTLRR